MPPYPDRDDKVFGVLVNKAKDMLDGGESAEVVILDLAAHAWMEGHLEGHECAGDEAEPGDAHLRQALRKGKTPMSEPDRN
jgi:hypothetical protein